MKKLDPIDADLKLLPTFFEAPALPGKNELGSSASPWFETDAERDCKLVVINKLVYDINGNIMQVEKL